MTNINSGNYIEQSKQDQPSEDVMNRLVNLLLDLQNPQEEKSEFQPVLPTNNIDLLAEKDDNLEFQPVLSTNNIDLLAEKDDNLDRESPSLTSENIVLEPLLNLLMGESNLLPTETIEIKIDSKLPEPKPNKSDILPVNNQVREELGTKLEELHQEDSVNRLKQLQGLLVGSNLSDIRTLVAYINEKVAALENHLYKPEELMNLLLPVIADLLGLKIAESREEIIQIIAPIMDEMIEAKIQEDKPSMSAALAPILPDAILSHISSSPGDFAKAIAPEIGAAIKEQIILERDAMVDALYPVIGNTVSKYIAEAIKTINQKVENAFSIEGIKRKIRAKMQGVSEAELIFKESMPFAVQAIFLIHKISGLLIAEVQPNQQILEAEMMAGMLTAIRSFVNDCIAQSGEVSELDQIEYGNSKIILEVAGYCYLAVVVTGEPPKKFIVKMRDILSQIVLKYENNIKLFDGDPSTVPEEINILLSELIAIAQQIELEKKDKKPTGLLIMIFSLVSLVSLAIGFNHYHQAKIKEIESKTTLALDYSPELSIYKIITKMQSDKLQILGKVPSQYHRLKAEQIVKEVVKNQPIENKIITIEVPVNPLLTAEEVQRITNILNQLDGIKINTQYQNNRVNIQGRVISSQDAQKITQAFAKIPGVQTVTNTVEIKPLRLPVRIYFDLGSSQIKYADIKTKIRLIKQFMQQYPSKHLKIIGRSDRSGMNKTNQQLAMARAKIVQSILISEGVDPKRLLVTWTTKLSLGINYNQPLWLSRLVEFEPITPEFIRK
jgi:outer membrane protein OmpA-like peptidoglycan-associated protein